MKPAPHRLLESAYPFSIELQTRFGDIDVLGHLNNAAIVRLYEEGRSRFAMTRLADARQQPRDWLGFVANVNVSYLGEGNYPAPVVITSGIARIGSSSHVVGHGLFQNGKCIGVCDCTIVTVSRATRKPLALPDLLREKLSEFLIREPAAP